MTIRTKSSGKLCFQRRQLFISELSFKIGSPSMVFGKDLVRNVTLLANTVDHIEIVLFYTPELHNIPAASDIEYLKRIGTDNNITYSVHLPAFLEMASTSRIKRKDSVQLAGDIITRMNAINPLHYIIHIPFTTPTLTAEPGVYFSLDHGELFFDWTGRALNSLSELQDKTGQGTKMLVENINYSPSFLEPFLYSGLCELCLDLGHLLLGRERVLDVLKNYFTKTGEIHLHGVKGYEEHLSLSVLSKKRVTKWLRYLRQFAFNGIVTLEVFTPGDLEESMRILSETLSPASHQT